VRSNSAWVEAANGYAVPPDLTLFVHVAPAVAAQRRAARGGAKELFEEDALQRRTARQYEEAIRWREA
jgi:dTMP kinase